MSTMVTGLVAAMNSRSALRVAALFAADYRSAQPVHPGRGFGGSAQVLDNWTAVFDGVPDFVAELVDHSITGNTEWGEWYWHGHHTDGSAFAMRGVIILTVRDDLISEARLYLEPVDAMAGDIGAAVRDLYKPPDPPSP
jgi:ketosteroid isomerase-like protein